MKSSPIAPKIVPAFAASDIMRVSIFAPKPQGHDHDFPFAKVPDYIGSGFCVKPAKSIAAKMPCVVESGTNTGATPENLFSRSQHAGGVGVTLCDGSVRFISNSVDLTTWRNLGSSQDAQVLGTF